MTILAAIVLFTFQRIQFPLRSESRVDGNECVNELNIRMS